MLYILTQDLKTVVCTSNIISINIKRLKYDGQYIDSWEIYATPSIETNPNIRLGIYNNESKCKNILMEIMYAIKAKSGAFFMPHKEEKI